MTPVWSITRLLRKSEKSAKVKILNIKNIFFFDWKEKRGVWGVFTFYIVTPESFFNFFCPLRITKKNHLIWAVFWFFTLWRKLWDIFQKKNFHKKFSYNFFFYLCYWACKKGYYCWCFIVEFGERLVWLFWRFPGFRKIHEVKYDISTRSKGNLSNQVW